MRVYALPCVHPIVCMYVCVYICVCVCVCVCPSRIEESMFRGSAR